MYIENTRPQEKVNICNNKSCNLVATYVTQYDAGNSDGRVIIPVEFFFTFSIGGGWVVRAP